METFINLSWVAHPMLRCQQHQAFLGRCALCSFVLDPTRWHVHRGFRVWYGMNIYIYTYIYIFLLISIDFYIFLLISASMTVHGGSEVHITKTAGTPRHSWKLVMAPSWNGQGSGGHLSAASSEEFQRLGRVVSRWSAIIEFEMHLLRVRIRLKDDCVFWIQLLTAWRGHTISKCGRIVLGS